ncbi:urease subunit gamma [Solirubrobacter sp. CPCC 204708]|uniref:urease n=1 Tax=Solirubrobacter deserti TaxID=2282478 RepID=A0ABT4RU22_9ACTN|nr:urease subunit gamma [Solirubrobacter deserti]MBE2315677.1 urease subunit gamma [Solirubrobacter deserti]MDA0141745.1 urease subunit gamma [Solirubrobacter deserti]
MHLLPSEESRLLLYLAAELARKRRARGLELTQAEAVALIADEVCEAARDGRSYADVEAFGYTVLGPADVLDGVADAIPRVEVEPLFEDGHRLVVLHDPIRRGAPPEPVAVEPEWLAEGLALEVVNEGEVPVGVTSHFHFFETNRVLRFDRAAAYGHRLAIAPGAKVVFNPGEPLTVRLVPIAGARVVRGHGGLVDGPLDDPGARDAALQLARERGYRGA